jgi:hypothetical protein
VLTQLTENYGVQGGSINESGTLIRLDLRPGADAERVAAEASRALSAHVEDRTAVRLDWETAAAALRGELWREPSSIADSSVAQDSPLEPNAGEPAGWWLLTLLLACGVVSLGVVRRKRRDPDA